MRIAIIGSRGYPYVYSGYETLVARLAPGLAARGHEVTVYCHRGLFRDRPASVSGVRLVYCHGIRSKTLGQLSHSLSGALHAITQRYDVVFFVNSANGPIGSILRAARIPSVINVDGLEWLRPKWKGLGAKYFRWASRVATILFDGVITDAEEMAAVYRREFGAESTTIAYGADVDSSHDQALISQYGITPRGYYLVVGRLIPDNNVDLLVSGMEGSSSKRTLVVVGDVPYRDAFATRVRSTRDPRVVFTGYMKDQNTLRELYCNCYAYLHGHEFGGTNPALLKALGFGCCIVALDTPFSREVLGQDHGRFFPKDAGALAGVIDSLDRDPVGAEALRRRAQSRIRERYTWDGIIQQYEEYFVSLVARVRDGRRPPRNRQHAPQSS